jgi:outer membrane beta-barrel protein
LTHRLALGVLAAAVALASVPHAARADAESDAPVFAVQNRQVNLKHEFHLGFGVLPINAFTKGLAVQAGYTYHFNPLVAWEIAQFTYAFGVDTSLKQQLVQDYGVMPARLDPFLNYFASSNVVFKPLYGKFSLTNRWVVHIEAFFVAGPSVGVFAVGQSPAPGFDVGGGLRVFINDLFSVRLDARDLTHFYSSLGASTQSELYLGIAAAISLGGGAK